MNNITPNRAGLVLGTAFAVYHGIWVLAMAIGLGSSWLRWTQSLHFMALDLQLLDFNLLTGLIGVVGALVMGYAMGWIFGFIWQKTK